MDPELAIPVAIDVESMEDFKPERVAQKVEPIRRLVEERKKLNEIALKATNPKTERMLENILKDHDALKKLSAEAEKAPSGEGGNG